MKEKEPSTSRYESLARTARDYYALCARAERLGIAISLDDPRSPKTVAGLRAAVEAATK